MLLGKCNTTSWPVRCCSSLLPLSLTPFQQTLKKKHQHMILFASMTTFPMSFSVCTWQHLNKWTCNGRLSLNRNTREISVQSQTNVLLLCIYGQFAHLSLATRFVLNCNKTSQSCIIGKNKGLWINNEMWIKPVGFFSFLPVTGPALYIINHLAKTYSIKSGFSVQVQCLWNAF